MTARLPNPGSDDGTWGSILNEFLDVAHNGDGSLQTDAIKNAGGVTSINGKTPTDGSVTLTATDLGVTGSSSDLSAIANANPTAGNVSLNGHKLTNVANGTVATDAVTFGQLPTSLPPNGTAGGDLSGSYPNPTVKKVNGTTVTVSGMVNLTDYGTNAAAGTALNAAIAALGTSGGIITIPAGTWTIDTEVLVNKNGVILQGAGSATILAFNGSNIPTMLAMADTTQRYMTIRDLKIVQTGTSGTGTAIDASYFVNSVFERLRIGDGQNPNKAIIFDAIGSYYNVIRDSRINVSGTGSVCISFNNTSNSNVVQNCRLLGDANTVGVYTNCNGIIIDHIDMESAGSIGIHLDTQAYNCTIINPYIESLTTGIQLESGCGPISLINGDLGGCTSPITDNGAVGFKWENTWAWSTTLPNSMMSSSSTSTQLWGVKESADTNARLAVNSAGALSFGPGNAASDASITRVGTQTLQVNGSLDVSINERVQENLTIGGTSPLGSGGAGVLELKSNVAPTANPTNGSALYSASGTLKYLDPSGNTWNLNVLNASGTTPTISGGSASGGNLQLLSTTSVTKGQILLGSSAVADSTSSIQLGSTTPSFGGGSGVIGVTNATTTPTTNPSGGGILYASGGEPMWRDPSGNVYNLTSASASLPNMPVPSDFSYAAWTYDPIAAVNSLAPTSGTIYLSRIQIRLNTTVSKVIIGVSSTSGMALTSGENFIGIYNASGTQVGTTADITASLTTSGELAFALTSSTTLTSGFYWIAILMNGTAPALARGEGLINGFGSSQLTSSTRRFGAITGTNTSLPSSFTPTSITSVTSNTYWAAVA